jgi:hypothetical protein
MSGITVVMCGQMRSMHLLMLSLEQVYNLYLEGEVQRLILSTWRGEVEKVDGGAGFFRDRGIQVIESDFPPRLAIEGNVFQQMLAMDRALDEIDDDDLVLRTRTDLAFASRDALRAVLAQDLTLGPVLIDEGGPPIFSERIWTPYFHPSFPFYFADQLFLGRARDLRKLNNYDMHTEAYGITSRPHECNPGHSSGAAAEIRRFLGPFLQRFPVLREYRFVWPKLCLGTPLMRDVLIHNMLSDCYPQYQALSLAMTARYFRVGDVPEALNKVIVIGGGAPEPVVPRASLVQEESRGTLVSERLAIPPEGAMLFNPQYSARWVGELFAEPGRDPLAEVAVLQPLAEAVAFRGDRQRREQFARYRDGLWALADRP